MTLDDDARETCSFELEIEVPGTPEEVWEAIATGPGISAWMHPTEVEEREGGRFTFDMGSGPQEGRVIGWDPPRRFVEQTDWAASEATPAASIATEWLVEARGAGTCVVRMVMSGFGTGASWDDEISGVTEGMELALANLRRYLTHFGGRRGVWVRAFGKAPGSRAEGWTALTAALGLPPDARAGDRVETREGAGVGGTASGAEAPHQAVQVAARRPEVARATTSGADATDGRGVPRLAGTVDQRYEGRCHSALLLVLDEPGPGIANVIVFGERGWATVQACLYGDDADAIAAREEPAWQAWMRARFPTTEAA